MNDNELPPRPRLLPSGMDQVQLYRNESVLEADLVRCLDRGWAVIEFDTAGWSDHDRLHDDLGGGLRFPSYYGRNLDALADLSLEVAAGRRGFPPDAPGGVLLLRHFDRFAAADRRTAEAVLDILVIASNRALQYGWALLVFLHSDDPDLRLGPVAATIVDWNATERPTSKRQI